MTSRSLLASVLALLAGCPMVEPRPPRCDPSEPTSCPDGMACDIDPAGGHGCVETCPIEVLPWSIRCANGAFCNTYFGVEPLHVCSLGGTVGPGEIVDSSMGEECVFGYLPVRDWTADPFVSRCLPVCRDDEDCAPGSACNGEFGCRANCMELGSCGPGNYCFDDYVCMSEAHWRELDCDGDLVPDCGLYGRCGVPPEPVCVRAP